MRRADTRQDAIGSAEVRPLAPGDCRSSSSCSCLRPCEHLHRFRRACAPIWARNSSSNSAEAGSPGLRVWRSKSRRAASSHRPRACSVERELAESTDCARATSSATLNAARRLLEVASCFRLLSRQGREHAVKPCHEHLAESRSRICGAHGRVVDLERACTTWVRTSSPSVESSSRSIRGATFEFGRAGCSPTIDEDATSSELAHGTVRTNPLRRSSHRAQPLLTDHRNCARRAQHRMRRASRVSM